ncbi:MAG: aspartate aminotransferase family protein [Gammaproteobacteria bacterium]|nr:aspartate aminotransferase family protein [Gammaproteobacteria bacterium]
MSTQLPQRGLTRDELVREFDRLSENDVDWRAGKAAVYVFDAGADVREIAAEAYTRFLSENGLGPAAFPSLATMESDVVAMGLALLNAPPGAKGNMTSGGTESIFLSVKACRDWARAHKPHISAPQIVAPHTAHPAFDKAGEYLGLEVIRVPVTSALVADPDAMANAITSNTVMVMGSAPCFPFGLIDPIERIAAIAEQHGLWMHVDACVGGYFSPFARMNGVALPRFDFEISGVHSMSADLHKYGYAAKGASTVLFRDEARHAFQGFDFDNWPCRAMSTPTFAGTRPGGAIAAAWAVMNYLGVDGYCERANTVIRTREKLQREVEALGLRVHGDPQLGLIAFGSDDVDIIAVGEDLRAGGWVSSRTVSPDGIHLMLSPGHADIIDEYVAALTASVAKARDGKLAPSRPQDVRYA